MKRPLFRLMVLPVLILALLPLPGQVEAEDSVIDEKKEAVKKRDKEIQRLEREKKQTLADREQALAKLEHTKKKLTKLNEQLYETEVQLERSRHNLDQIKRRIQLHKENYKNRIRRMYQQGEMFYIDSLVKADSIGEFLHRLEVIRLLAKRDEQMLQQYEIDKQKAERERKKIASLLEQQRQQSIKAKEAHSKLKAEFKKYEAHIADLDRQQDHLEKLNEKDQAAIRALVAKAARERQKNEQNKQKRTDGKVTAGKFLWPVKGGRLTSGYGMRYHPIRKVYTLHAGIDIAAPMGTPIYAAADGEVIESRPARGYGYIIVIYHGGGISTMYAHMYPQDVVVRPGQKVKRGQRIAAVGNNGYSTGPHLHLELFKQGKPVNPLPYFR